MGPYEQSKTFSIFDRNDYMQFFPLVFFFRAFIFLNYYHWVHTSKILWYWSFNFRYLHITYVFYNYIIRYYISDIRQLDNYLKVVDVMLNGSTSYLSMIYFFIISLFTLACESVEQAILKHFFLIVLEYSYLTLFILCGCCVLCS